MTRVLQNIIDNPILMRELRRRMRGKALIYSIISYIALMTIVTVFILLIYSPSPFAHVSQEMLEKLQNTGLQIFRSITGVQMLLVLIIAPTITAGVTTGEKERKTFDFLRVTTISRWMYIMGCFLSTAFYVALALICALPLISITFLYGGVGLHDVLRMFFFLLGASCVLSSFGLYISSVTERTRTAQGLVVFMIFALIFGGFFLYQQYLFFFSAATAGGPGAAASAVRAGAAIYIFSVAVPPWALGVLALIGVSWIFLLLAARKLFEPEETRAFSHLQFALLFSLLIGGFIGLLSSNPFTKEIPELVFLTCGYVMLLFAVQCFAIGRMEVGDEIWHLKRLVPFLRPLDQTLPFLAILGLAWFLILSFYSQYVAVPNIPLGLVHSVRAVSISSFAFFVFLGRAMTAHTGSRRKAWIITLSSTLGLIVAFPLLISAGAAIFNAHWLWREFYAFSPVAMLVDGFQNPKDYDSAAMIPVGLLATAVYTALALGLAIYGETKRYTRWKNFDYHYDMPAG